MTALDAVILLLYGAAVLWIGLWAGRGQTKAGSWLLADRALPTWAVLCSLVATELSAATFIGVPQAAYLGDWSYLQLAFGALAGKLVIARHVIPLYHRLGIVTVYGFLSQRYGLRTRRLAALCFTLGRLLASGVRLFIASLAFAVATGSSIELAIVVSGVVAGVYTRAGGLRSVVWTDVLQALLFAVAAAAMLAVIVSQASLGEIWSWAATGERTRIFHAAPLISLVDSRPFLVGLVGGFFLTLATHSTDHDMVQRLLATHTGRQGGLALAGSALLNFPLTALFLAIGTALAFFYAAQPPAYDVSDSARIVPTFALHELPAGLRGLAFAGLFAAAMSSLDSAICAIATTWVVDVRPARDEVLHARTRTASIVACAILIGAALLMSTVHDELRVAGRGPSLVEFALSSMTMLYGGLLGIFGLGMLSRRRGTDASAVAGLTAGALVGAALFLQPILLGESWIAWPWWIPLAASVTGAVAAATARDPSSRSSTRTHDSPP